MPYTPEQNGSVERENRTVVEAARTMLHAKNMEIKFWAEATNAAVFILNRTGTSSMVGKTPYELWYNKKPKFNHLQIYGSKVYQSKIVISLIQRQKNVFS